ncbi:ubiquinol-cytochrome c reductase iron-sulfur subunit [Spirosoma linguale]|uniref:Rieske (2Fe-2S) iron-sulphur domain protein n=1 Tax=Spirosoma linguale (strain ATCC 33905 / DSM 74 / LMG 10896 / Claus 1) TaxID=504472 RepID=D2QRF8_SPILD|nr:Rieske (2Fe-2S) iron-sulphur domain protein [Spirosoma linguale DSM 74]
MKSNPTADQMNRGEFIRSLGMSSAALMAFYCMGTTLSSCSSKGSDDPTPSTTTPVPSTGITGNAEVSKGVINFTLNLSDSTFNKLKTAGQYVLVGNLIVARTTAGQYVALSKTCTHEGTDVQYRSTQNDFFCPNHGSEFSTTGVVEVGPASRPLTQYKTAVSADGNSLTVTA